MKALEINLLPQEIQAAQARARHMRGWIAALIPPSLLLLLLLGIDGVRSVQADELRKTSEQLQSDLTAGRAEIRGLSGSVAQATLQLQRSDALRSKRAWSALIDLIGQCMPTDCWLDSLATDPELPSATPMAMPVAPSVSATSANGRTDLPVTVTIDAPRKLRLVGFSLSAGEPLAFVTNLKQTGVFSAVSLERSVLESESSQARFRFEIMCEW